MDTSSDADTKVVAPPRPRPANRRPNFATSAAEQNLQRYLEQESFDKRTFRRAVVLALVVHLGLLTITFPSLTGAAPVEAKKDKVYAVEVVRFKPPEPPKDQKVPPKRTVRMPMPDPTPQDPEPLRTLEPAEYFEPAVDDIRIDIPLEVPELDSGPTYVIGDVVKPEKIKVVAPRYTEIARKARIHGTVILQSTIDETGNVIDVSVLKGLPMGLSEAAMEAVRQWKFKPATLGDKPVAVYFNLTVTFELQ